MTLSTPIPRAPARMTTGFAFSYVERCIKESLASRKFGKEDMAIIVDEVCGGVPECIYCGSPEVRRWDHLFPVAQGGDTVIGNMVPACSRCDDSKQDLPYRDWVLSDARFSPRSRHVPDLDARLARIDAYVAAHSYAPRSVDDRLTDSEKARLDAIRKRSLELRQDLEALIADVRMRTGEQ